MRTERSDAKRIAPTGGEGLTGSRIVNPDSRVSPASVFRGPTWNMQALVTIPGIAESDKHWDFRRSPGFPTGFALSLAEYAYARLYKPVATHGRQGEWLTVRNELYALNSFAKYCLSQDRNGFHEIDDSLLTQYRQHIFVQEGKSEDRVRTIFQSIYRMWDYRSAISWPLSDMPFGKEFEKIFPVKRDKGEIENTTPPIPEPIYAAVMGVALDYVLKYSPILLSVWAELQALWDNEFQPKKVTQKRKLTLFSAEAKKVVQKVDAYWRSSPLRSYSDLSKELQHLRRAGMLVILAYSGIRSSELLSLEAECYVKDKGPDGQFVYYINTILHKHRDGGCRDTWVVIEEVVQAIKVLEALTKDIRSAANDDRLMLSDRTNSFFAIHKDFTNKKITEYTMAALVWQIQEFQDYCNSNLKQDPIPEWPNELGEKEPWKFNVRQFRRTLARYIARQPFGIVAGMLQYKHLEVVMFQGYAGTEPDWNKLLENEKVLASIDILGEVAIDLSQGAVAGAYGDQIKTEFFAEFKGRAEDFPPSQIAKWLANTRKGLFVGKFNFCFYDPIRALCKANADSTDQPILNFCQPGHCGNACIGKRHKPLWEAQLNQARELAKHKDASTYQRHILLEEVAQLEAVVSDLISGA